MNFIRFLTFILIVASVSSCQQSSNKAGQKEAAPVASTGNFGDAPAVENAVPATELTSLFTDSDTVSMTLSGDISSSCKHTGCWMDLDMGNNATVHVTFRDDKFTIPLDAAGKHAIAQGIAVRELIPVETLRNYAREDGQSEEEVARITEPEWNYEMIADGVLIEE